MNDEYGDYLEASSRSNRRIAGLVIAAVVMVAAVIFVLQNTDETNVEFLFLSGRAPLYAVILVSMALGALITWMIGILRRRRRRAKLATD